jgi:hypothetical protein
MKRVVLDLSSKEVRALRENYPIGVPLLQLHSMSDS